MSGWLGIMEIIFKMIDHKRLRPFCDKTNWPIDPTTAIFSSVVLLTPSPKHLEKETRLETAIVAPTGVLLWFFDRKGVIPGCNLLMGVTKWWTETMTEKIKVQIRLDNSTEILRDKLSGAEQARYLVGAKAETVEGRGYSLHSVVEHAHTRKKSQTRKHLGDCYPIFMIF